MRYLTKSSATAEMARCGGNCAVQSHSRSLIFGNIDRKIVSDFLVNNSITFILFRTVWQILPRYRFWQGRASL